MQETTGKQLSVLPLRDNLKSTRNSCYIYDSMCPLTFSTDGVQKANQVFLPVLENASKAEKLRTTLTVFERSKFFFNLPSFIFESIEAVCFAFKNLTKCMRLYAQRRCIGTLRDCTARL